MMTLFLNIQTKNTTNISRISITSTITPTVPPKLDAAILDCRAGVTDCGECGEEGLPWRLRMSQTR
jgi:hypothetical protein